VFARHFGPFDTGLPIAAQKLANLGTILEECGTCGGHMTHYHIRWSTTARLDWQPFGTRAEAEAGAKEWARFGETYTIEEFDENCIRCAELKLR
jgi:hypothetical protein